MITVNDMPAQIDASVMKLLAKVETATVGHFRTGIFMPPDFRPVLAEMGAVGTAVTLPLPGWIRPSCTLPWALSVQGTSWPSTEATTM